MRVEFTRAGGLRRSLRFLVLANEFIHDMGGGEGEPKLPLPVISPTYSVEVDEPRARRVWPWPLDAPAGSVPARADYAR